MSQVQHISLDPDDAVAGGLLDDINVVWSKPSFVEYDYGGKSEAVVPALKVTLLDQDTKEEVGEQYWKSGNLDNIKPTPDGKGLVPVPGRTGGINNKSRIYQLLLSLKTAGMPKEKMADVTADITILDGLVCHMVQEPALSKPLTPKKRQDGSEYDSTVLVVESVKKWPWEKGGGPTGAKKGAAAAKGAAKAAEPAGDLEEICVGFIKGMVEELGMVEKKTLPTEVMKRLSADSRKTAILKVVFDDVWLSKEGQPWAYADGMIMPA